MQSPLSPHCLLLEGFRERGQGRAIPPALPITWDWAQSCCFHQPGSADGRTEEPDLGTGVTEKGFSFPLVHSWSVCRNCTEEFLCDTIWLFSTKIPEKKIFCCLFFVRFVVFFSFFPDVCISCVVWSEEVPFLNSQWPAWEIWQAGVHQELLRAAELHMEVFSLTAQDLALTGSREQDGASSDTISPSKLVILPPSKKFPYLGHSALGRHLSY